ncbi:MAG: hypothetical protein IJA97_02960 [Clostridia bacterium]|nr:hypothetical protein [Clostridia bacterium]
MEENKLHLNEISSVQSRAKDITNHAKEQYKAEVEKLKLFNARWNNYVNSIVKEYPSDKTRKLAYVSELITDILMKEETPSYTALNKIEDIYKIVDDGRELKFDKSKSLYGKTESGFNMEDVLNPGELDLMSLCKELGATD